VRDFQKQQETADIGYADELGSGVTNLFKYSRLYSGKEPKLIEGDIFKIIVPLDDGYSFDVETSKVKPDVSNRQVGGLDGGLKSDDESRVLLYIKNNTKSTSKEISDALKIPQRTIERIIALLKENGIIERKNGKRNGYWEVKEI
jgi:ATP-dependent DNA helicase RecG